MASRNPFRLQTEASSSSLPVSATPTENSTAASTDNDQPASSSSAADILNEELPPAYTPTPNSNQGEETIEYGPTRPFQNPPPPPRQTPPQQPITAQSTGWSNAQNSNRPLRSLLQQITGSLTDHINGSSYGTYPNTVAYRPSPPPQAGWTPQSPAPPPLPPRPSLSPASPTSDFARDFYAAGPGEGTSEYPPPPGPPPAGPPPDSDDDGRPTKTPTPGRPLLNNGRLLVYPPGYECYKCAVLVLYTRHGR